MSNILLKSDDNCDWRLERLNVALSLVNYNMKQYIYTEIEQLEDHEGTLTVTWKSKPNESDKNLLQKIWETVNEYDVRHEYYVLVEDKK